MKSILSVIGLLVLLPVVSVAGAIAGVLLAVCVWTVAIAALWSER